MYKLNGQVELQGLINGSDIINIESFIDLQIQEQAGLMLPEFHLTLSIPAVDLKVIKAGSEISIFLARGGTEQRQVYIFDILKIDKVISENIIILSGLVKSKGFYDINRYNIIEGASTSVFAQVSSPYFKYVSNIDNSNDYQRWYQSNITDRDYLSKVWRNSYIGDSFLMLAIDKKSNFLVMSYAEQVKEENVKPLYANEESFNLDPSGFVEVDNSLEQTLGQAEEETSAAVNIDGAYPQKLNKTSASEFFSSNCHANYAYAKINNKNNLKLHSSHQLIINQIGVSAYNLLDSVRVDVKNKPDDFIKNYIISKIITVVRQDQISVSYTLSSS